MNSGKLLSYGPPVFLFVAPRSTKISSPRKMSGFAATKLLESDYDPQTLVQK